jgi:hypothetical protein
MQTRFRDSCYSGSTAKLPSTSPRVRSLFLKAGNVAAHHMYRETFLNVCNQHPQFLQIRSLSADEIDGDTVSLHEPTSSETTTLASWASTSSLRRASVDTIASSVGNSGSSLRETSSNALHKASPQSKVEGLSAGALTIRTACQYDCYCKCHSQGAATNRGFPRLSGSKFLCTDPNCQAARSSEEPAALPSRFFRKAISQVMSSKSIKVRYDLNTFRMVSEGSDAMRYVKHGNLDKLKMCIKTGEATLWDTAPDGWSLLHVSLDVKVLKQANRMLDCSVQSATTYC